MKSARTGQKHIRYVQHSYKVKADGFNSLVAHMKRKETIVREEFDKDGTLLVRETTTIEEDDTKVDAPKQTYPSIYPWDGVISGTTNATNTTFVTDPNSTGKGTGPHVHFDAKTEEDTAKSLLTDVIKDVLNGLKKDFGLT